MIETFIEIITDGQNQRFALAAFDCVTGILVFCALTSRTMHDLPLSARLLVSICGAGLLAQSGITYARANDISVEHLWWTWALKDIGIGGLAIFWWRRKDDVRIVLDKS